MLKARPRVNRGSLLADRLGRFGLLGVFFSAHGHLGRLSGLNRCKGKKQTGSKTRIHIPISRLVTTILTQK